MLPLLGGPIVYAQSARKDSLSETFEFAGYGCNTDKFLDILYDTTENEHISFDEAIFRTNNKAGKVVCANFALVPRILVIHDWYLRATKFSHSGRTLYVYSGKVIVVVKPIVVDGKVVGMEEIPREPPSTLHFILFIPRNKKDAVSRT
jgi:hypothetical protein